MGVLFRYDDSGDDIVAAPVRRAGGAGVWRYDETSDYGSSDDNVSDSDSGDVECLGYPLCRTAWLRFLGIGKERLNRTRKRYRGIDDRTINQGNTAHPAIQTASVHAFFGHMWWTAGESMPTKFESEPTTSEHMREQLLQRLVDERLLGPTRQDFKVHAELCDELLGHYSAQWADRQVYWKVMLSLQKVWRRCRATSTSFPGEFPGVVIPGVLDGLPHQGQGLELDERQPRAWRTQDGSRDVFCMVKQAMSSTQLCQNPLLVWPATLGAQSQKMLEDCNSPTCPIQGCEISDDRIEELKLLREAISRDFPHMRRTVAWYTGMIDKTRDSSVRPISLTFVRHNTAHDLDNVNVQLGQRPVPPKPHELQVVFHRARL
ncbi:unnamed protein product [Cladocopium goreaui]|uniref:Uncharacterized protein n=1 Tax=Cladocopium goreaui TaxID=2562237 RepID=A0A9P1FJE0_9DINO|nr:unnamed protein product [Cladocopium goreaui]